MIQSSTKLLRIKFNKLTLLTYFYKDYLRVLLPDGAIATYQNLQVPYAIHQYYNSNHLLLDYLTGN